MNPLLRAENPNGSAGAGHTDAGGALLSQMRCVLALLSCITLLAGCGAEPGLEKIPVDGIENYSRLLQSDSFMGSPVGFGGATRPEAMPWLRKQGFATIINFRLESEEGVDIPASRAAAEAAGLDYVHVPLNSKAPAADLLERFVSIAANPDNQPVYLHCSSATRVAAVWMASRVQHNGESLDGVAAAGAGIAGRPADAMQLARALLAGESGR